MSSLGIGTYLGAADDATDQAYTDALIAAGEGGINLFDSAINYRGQRSERAIGAALQQLQRDEIVVCTKAGFLTPGAVPAFLKPEHVVGGMHSMDPDFLADQIDRSRANLGVDTIDVFYLHNPETQLGFLTRDEFDARIRRAFARLEQLVAEQKIRWYGAATWDGFRKRRAQPAADGGTRRRSRRSGASLPLHPASVQSGDGGGVRRTSRRACWRRRRAWASRWSPAPRSPRARCSNTCRSAGAACSPAMTNAQRAIQFTRSTPGIAAALVGMSRREHVLENLGVARVVPITREQYLRLYQ